MEASAAVLPTGDFSTCRRRRSVGGGGCGWEERVSKIPFYISDKGNPAALRRPQPPREPLPRKREGEPPPGGRTAWPGTCAGKEIEGT